MKLRIWCVIASTALLVSACSTPAVDPSKRSGYEKERARLADLLRGKRIAVTGVDRSTGRLCEDVFSARKVEKEIASWGARPVEWSQRLPSDVTISYGWKCEGAFSSAGSAMFVGTLLSLGTMPAAHTQHVALDVIVGRNGKTIFQATYADQREAADNVWASNAGLRRLDMADVLIEKFVKELERDGALEP